MHKKTHTGLIKPHQSKILVLARLLDVTVIFITLWAVLQLEYLDWTEKQSLWLLIALIGFLLFAEFNELYRESRGEAITEKIKRILISWFWVAPVFFVINFFVLLIDPVCTVD